MAKENIFSLSYITGYNDTDPPTDLAEDQCVFANNVEFFDSTLGERRLGCTDVDMAAAITGDSNMQAVTFLHRHLPSTDETASELWLMAQHLVNQFFRLVRKTTSWTQATLKDDIDVTSNRGFKVAAQTLHGKLFLAYKSVGNTNRLHVVDPDGTDVRRTGLAEPPAAPLVTDNGSGTFIGVRYYRVRFIREFTDYIIRSEPSSTAPFVPSGTGSGARITKPATISEGETHWEVEASVDNANFYRITTVAVGTTTYDDTTPYSPGYATLDGSVLSEDIGDYSLIHSGQFLAADEDRLVIGGSWEDDELASRVSWTPVYNDPGDGNDERIPIDTTNFLDLDGFEGGPLTHLSNPINGAIWAFKRNHSYKLIRTGLRDRAYQAFNVSKTLGALPGSVVEGVDQYGMPCLYFLDPEVGPCRTGGQRIIQTCSRDIMETWSTVNTDAIVVSRAIYYPEKLQVHWFIATDASNFPTLRIVLQTNNTRESEDGVRGGWARWDGKISQAYAACMYAEDIDANDPRSLVLRPFIGVTSTNGYLLRCDTGDDDNGTAFTARIVTRPFVLRDLLSKFKAMAVAILAKAHATAQVKVNLIRDFGVEESTNKTTTLAAVGSEAQVVKQLRDIKMSGMYAMQIEFEDVASPSGQWQLNRIDVKISNEATA